MSLTRSLMPVLALLLTPALLRAAAPPTPLPLARWAEEFASDDESTRQAAAENLWKAGAKALPVLRAAATGKDRILALRAKALLTKIEWGILPDTPASVVKEVERYRDGDVQRKRAALASLVRLGGPGFVAIRALLARETDPATKKEILNRLRTSGRLAAQVAISRDDLAGAEQILETTALTGDVAAQRDLIVFRTLTHKAEDLAESLEKRGESLRLAALLYRAIGDLERARAMAEKSGDKALLAGILAEQEDYKALLKMDLPRFRATYPKACLLWRTGDLEGFEALLDKVPDVNAYTVVCLFNGRPRDGVGGCGS
jgi:hypothetical protein